MNESLHQQTFASFKGKQPFTFSCVRSCPNCDRLCSCFVEGEGIPLAWGTWQQPPFNNDKLTPFFENTRYFREKFEHTASPWSLHTGLHRYVPWIPREHRTNSPDDPTSVQTGDKLSSLSNIFASLQHCKITVNLVFSTLILEYIWQTKCSWSDYAATRCAATSISLKISLSWWTNLEHLANSILPVIPRQPSLLAYSSPEYYHDLSCYFRSFAHWTIVHPNRPYLFSCSLSTSQMVTVPMLYKSHLTGISKRYITKSIEIGKERCHGEEGSGFEQGKFHTKAILYVQRILVHRHKAIIFRDSQKLLRGCCHYFTHVTFERSKLSVWVVHSFPHFENCLANNFLILM